ncbi:MAG: prenyltransferase/squalene oxidase repeat-containing protein [Pirellulales bacterium]
MQGSPAPAANPPRPAVQPAPADEAGAGQPAAPLAAAGKTAPPPLPARPILVSQAARHGRVVLRETPLEPEDELKRLALKQAPPWLISFVLHMLLVIVLGMWMVAGERSYQGVFLDVFSDELGEQLDDPWVSLPNTDDVAAEESQVITPSDLATVDDPFAAPPQMDLALDGQPRQIDIAAPQIGLALRGRNEGMKETLLKAYGGTAQGEEAVMLGLEWLARQQRKDGSWSLRGPYSSGAGDTLDNPQAATAMALLAFQGAGHTHQSGKFQEQVNDGFYALLRWQDREGNFFPMKEVRRDHNWMYTQAQCTIALCELYGMTKDPALAAPAQLAVDFCVAAQDPELGGWRYTPRQQSDVSVTGWVVMALQSARMAGLNVPSTTLERVSEFLDKVTDDGSRYGYMLGNLPTLPMTAEALLCRQYLGWKRDDQRMLVGADYLLDNLPRWEDRDVYYWYYGTQVMHHLEGDQWKRWNGAMRDMLIEHQEKSGREKGSWDPLGKSPDIWAFRGQGGRLYTTCLSLYMLEVYYRHLPIYSNLHEFIGR